MTIELAYSDEGARGGMPLLLGSSLGTTRAMWDEQMPALTVGHRVVRFDHRGHGASPVASEPSDISDLGGDVIALLDRLGIERADYAGLSLGGMVGMWLASHHPERINRLALFCTSAHLPPAPLWLDRAASVRAGGMAAIADAVVLRWFTPGFIESGSPAYARVRDQLDRTDPEGYAQGCEVVAALDLRADLAAITAPTLIVVGASDVATPIEHGQVMAEGINGSRLEVVDGAHIAVVENPQACTALLLDHLGATT